MTYEVKPCIYYKLRNFKGHDSLEIDSKTIKCHELKEKLHVAMDISKERFDLRLLKSHNCQVYPDDEMVHSLTMVLVQRIPVEGRRIPKTSRPEFVAAREEAAKKEMVPTEKWIAMPEEERLKHILQQNTHEADKRVKGKHGRERRVPQGRPPVEYVCRNCHTPGHWIQLCPLKKYKKAHGILACELMPATKDDPLAMITPDGRFVKRIAEQRMLDAEKQRKAAKRALSTDGSTSSSSAKKIRI